MLFLLHRKADLDVSETGDYALSCAVRLGYEEVGVLIQAGVNYPEPAPIIGAIMCGQNHVANLLIEHGAKTFDPLDSAWAERFIEGT